MKYIQSCIILMTSLLMVSDSVQAAQQAPVPMQDIVPYVAPNPRYPRMHKKGFVNRPVPMVDIPADSHPMDTSN